MTRICIVTPDIIGPIRNGGIGTACFHLAKYLSDSLGHEVSLLFTGPVEIGTAAGWREHYHTAHGINFYSLNDLDPESDLPCHNGHWFITRSRRIHEWLSRQRFDQVHFQEWQANGFIAVQAKRCGLAHDATLLTCTLHSSTEWINEGGRLFVTAPHQETLLKYAERYAARHADITITPSQHMADWCQARGWQLRDPQVIPYLFETDAAAPASTTSTVDELCFFGRLETRKGLEIYTAALEKLSAADPDRVLQTLTFLGKEGTVSEGPAKAFLRRFATRGQFTVKLIDNLASAEAIAYLQSRPGCVAVLPSLLDNLPYTVIECLQHGIRFIASDVGGIPEMVAGRSHLFEPTANALAVKLDEIIANGLGPVPSRYARDRAREKWSEITRRRPVAPPPRSVTPADVTICIAHYNYGRYLPDLLDSLERQTVQDFAVVVVDDGSTDPASKAAFWQLRDKHAANSRWTFVEKPNGGIGETRNHAASLANTDYLVFMDADNEAEPEMVEVMVRAMAANPVDCLTCFMRAFADNSPTDAKKIIYQYTPTGPCLEAGLFSNCFGDANFIVRKDTFLAVGGFGLRRDASFEDWEFLARLSLRGHSQDVIPQPLFLYRHTPGGFSRTTSSYLNHMRIIQAYGEALPDWAGRMLCDIYAPIVPAAVPREQRGGLHGPRIGLLRKLERSLRRRRKKFFARMKSRDNGRRAA